MTDPFEHQKVIGASQAGKSSEAASLFTENTADGTITVTGAMMPRFDWTKEERRAASKQPCGLQLIDPEEAKE